MMASFKFYNYKVLDSTNDKARDLAKKGEHDFVVAAERQTKGRGRFKREWISEPGGLYMTIALKIKDADKIKYLTFIASIAVSKTIRKLAKLNALVKWPNDVLICRKSLLRTPYAFSSGKASDFRACSKTPLHAPHFSAEFLTGDKKICGILTETMLGSENYALIGIGANINQKKFPRSIADKTTSLKLKTNKQHNIKKISESILKEFSRLYAHYDKKNYEKIADEWKKYSHTLGKKIMAKTMNKIYVGTAIGIDENCSLLLRLNNGKIKRITEADIFAV